MTYGSLFSGVGGIDLGFDRAGMTCRWQVEKDDYACAILKKHWPDVPRWRDVRYFLGGKRWRKCRSAWDVDVIAGGFPCVDISNAGKREGIAGSRSGLWSEFARIVRLLRPRFVVVENVGALVLRGLDRVLGDLATLGYDAEWDRIPACALGAPHIRWRCFIVAAHTIGDRICLQGRGETKDQTREVEGKIRKQRIRSDVESIHGGHAPNTESRWSGQRWRQQFEAYCETQRHLYWANAESCLRGVDDGIPPPVMDGIVNRVHRLRCLGNAVVPQIAEWIGRRLMDATAGRD